jgi:hypothetical protein
LAAVQGTARDGSSIDALGPQDGLQVVDRGIRVAVVFPMPTLLQLVRAITDIFEGMAVRLVLVQDVDHGHATNPAEIAALLLDDELEVPLTVMSPGNLDLALRHGISPKLELGIAVESQWVSDQASTGSSR